MNSPLLLLELLLFQPKVTPHSSRFMTGIYALSQPHHLHVNSASFKNAFQSTGNWQASLD